MVKVCCLASGSRGNCIYVDAGGAKILIDVGLSAKAITQRAKDMDIDLSKVDAILVTHEHVDHIGGVPVLSKQLKIPAYCHPLLKEHITNKGGNYYGDMPEFELGFSVGGARITPFRTPHDATFSCGYNIESEGRRMAIATDLGVVTNGVYDNIVGADLIILESNHDIDMLNHSHYPPHLVRRILGNNGHLSNLACSHTLRRLYADGVSKFVLAHLSQENNRTDIALAKSTSELNELGAEDYTLEVALQERPSRIIEV